MPTRQTADYEPMMDELSPELAAEYMAEKRRRNISEAMMGQSQIPLVAPEVKGRFQGSISPFQGLAKIAQAYMANKGLEGSDAAMADIGKRNSSMQAEAVSQYKKNTIGTPNVPMGQPTEAGAIGVSPGFTPTLEQRQAAIADAMISNNPRMNKMGALDFARDTADQARKDTEKARLNQIALAEQERRITREEAADARAKEEVKQAQRDRENKEYLLKFAAGLRQEQAPTVTEVTKNGKIVKIDARTGRVIGDAPAMGKGKAMSTTAQKELIQTDEEIQGGAQALTYLKAAKDINSKAMGGFGSGAIATVGSILPAGIRPKTIDDTVELDNILQSSALPQLKAIFGGMPTEGERKILLDVQGSSSKTKEVREGIFKRAESAVQNRLKFAKDKAKSLREGNYFAGDGGMNAGAANPPASSVEFLLKKYK